MIALIFNAGSSTLKWSALDWHSERIEAEGNETIGQVSVSISAQVEAIFAKAPAFDAVGHRIVHGGPDFRSAVLIDAEVKRKLGALVPINPLHAPASLSVIEAVAARYASIPQVAAFDTTFHRTMPDEAVYYAIPFDWSERFGIRRYGFHGLSVRYAVERAARILGALPERMVVCHLGSGSSVTAVERGRSVDTSMGFTPLEGVTMATRPGSLDPGVLLYLLREGHFSIETLEDALSHRSGLLGLAGDTGDLRAILRAADQGAERARLAYQQLLLSLRRVIGSMIAVLGGIDALVFTGGIGENSAQVRKEVAESLAFLGLVLDSPKNEGGPVDADIASPGSKVRVLVIRAREDLAVLWEMRPLVSRQ